MNLKMVIKQGDNGWILEFTGHDSRRKVVVCSEWSELLKKIDDYFGWYNMDGHLLKKNP